MGGLGNQMFQIAAAYSLAQDNNDEAVFDFNKCYTPGQGHESNRYKETILKNINNQSNIFSCNFHEEEDFSYKEIKYRNNLMIKGYFQCEKYFYNNKQSVIDLFHISQEDISFLNDIFDFNNNKYVSVHIRRAEYLKYPDIHPVCEKSYYYKAMEFFPKETKFLFISDDIEWVKDNFKSNNFYFSENNTDILDLTLISLCDHNIIANSSFSWWGAYLNKNKNKTVIGPKHWFGPKGPKNQEIIPESWIKI